MHEQGDFKTQTSASLVVINIITLIFFMTITSRVEWPPESRWPYSFYGTWSVTLEHCVRALSPVVLYSRGPSSKLSPWTGYSGRDFRGLSPPLQANAGRVH